MVVCVCVCVGGGGGIPARTVSLGHLKLERLNEGEIRWAAELWPFIVE